jgi:HK97 family phage portal protein
VGLVDEVSSRALALRGERSVEERTIGGTPWLPFVPFGQGGPVHPSKYHIGQEHALRLAPLYGAVDLLANAVASLPLKIYVRQPDGTKQLWTGPSMFDDPDPAGGTYYEWMFAGMVSLLIHGNALGYIVSRDGFGYPTSIVWLPPERCDIIDDYSADFAHPTIARYFYEGRSLDRADLFHVRGLVMAGHTAGLSPLNAFKILIEGGLDRQDYAKQFFANGGFPIGIFKNSELEVDRDQSEAIRGTLTETLRRRQPLVIGRDWDYSSIVVPPEQAQFVETTRLDATQIAAIYHVPPERIGGSRGDSMTYSNQEQGTNDMISWSLRPWVRRWENAFFPIMPQRRYTKFDVDDLVRVDQSQRYANNKIARDTGWVTNDEIRYDEDRAPLEQGVGKEALPNEILVAMARGGAGVPKTWGPLLDISNKAEGVTESVTPGSKPALSIVPPGGTPPVNDQQAQGARYSVEEIATRCFGPVGAKQEYLDLVTTSARDAGYAVVSARSEQFSKEQADWIAADSLRRPRPIERFELNGHRNEVRNG